MTVIEQSGIDLFNGTLPSYDEIKTIADYANSSELSIIKFTDEANKAIENGNKLAGAIGLAIVGNLTEAIKNLNECKDCQEKLIFLGQCYRECREYDKAIECFDRAVKNNADNFQMSMEKVETLSKAQKVDEALKIMESCSNFENVSAEYHYQMGKLLACQGEHQMSIQNLEKAIELNPNHTDAMFQLAYSLDLHGDEGAAMDYYVQISKKAPVKTNVLLNMAILYEDANKFDKAYECVQLILQSFPNHKRARLFAKDVGSSQNMYYDEEHEKLKDRRNKVLEIPISDFELSVRSRNCLRKMSIYTLGDLLRINESELLSYKNFGETSLTEIRNILESKGLRLGMTLDEQPIGEPQTSADVSDEENEMMRKSIEELELSVRAKRALDRLNIKTFGELTMKTEAELLGCKNFGITSLTEIKEKLTKFGLTLRKLE